MVDRGQSTCSLLLLLSISGYSHKVRTLSATIGPLVALVSAAICEQACQPTRSPFPSIKETYHNTAIINTADNCRTGASSLRKRDTSGMESQVAVVVGEIEAAHSDGVDV